MLLSDRDIKAEVASGRVKLDPYTPELIQPSSIDVRLDRFFRVFENHRYPHIDPAIEQPDLTRLVETDGEEPFVLHPGEFVLASTFEIVSLPDDVAGRLEGKSSLGRLGLLTHSTAGWIDPGFSGHVTLELSNVATLPIKLWPGMKIGQLCLFRTSSPAEHPYGSAVYGSRYQDQRGPTPSRSYLNFYRTRVLLEELGPCIGEAGITRGRKRPSLHVRKKGPPCLGRVHKQRRRRVGRVSHYNSVYIRSNFNTVPIADTMTRLAP